MEELRKYNAVNRQIIALFAESQSNMFNKLLSGKLNEFRTSFLLAKMAKHLFIRKFPRRSQDILALDVSHNFTQIVL